MKQSIHCAYCGKEFFLRPSRIKGGQKLCSKICSGRYTRTITPLSGDKNGRWKGGVQTLNSVRVIRWRENNPIKAAAHDAVAYALRHGHLKKQPCEKCGDQRSQAHHDDYTKPLDVRWLCQKHHYEIHKEDRKRSSSEYFAKRRVTHPKKPRKNRAQIRAEKSNPLVD